MKKAAKAHSWTRRSSYASHPSEFVDYVPAPDGRYLSEVEAVRVKYNRLIAEADGDMDRIMAVIDRLRRWADSKTEDREEWARTVWWAVHLSASAKSTASMAVQAFATEVAEGLRCILPSHHGDDLAYGAGHELLREPSQSRVTIAAIEGEQLPTPDHGRVL